ncbi:hypothetical protein Desdi_1523 [Desulfitobacterium dichloroeliminans LMG P-21439]|uniref:Uncharacterized protein n=1 Tax=Desulfitobacterium dichloroeliminans (strain LMG P-21439 / DCA1) TaxID=871963 RepID=L0F8R0_DESDL|nr:hypothetical protein [Desulfitobacterium dichloroeliminans]AGA69016.1 hypothetical protein Desdi_1523 [Desulfitobacterium dichloroeliminans LMG P-21439]
MEQNVKPFDKFFSGNHLILGEAGSGKTKLIWSILQDKDYVKENSINIVLTDSEKRMWEGSRQNPVTIVNPYHSDISWATNPSKPGVYYCACGYVPRIITFLECLATWAIQNEKNIEPKVRVIIDVSSKTWALPEFTEQVNRLHFIASGQDENPSIEIWAALGSLKKLSDQAKSIFASINLVLLDPISPSWINEIKDTVGMKCDSLQAKLAEIKVEGEKGYYYAPCNGCDLYFQPQNNKC